MDTVTIEDKEVRVTTPEGKTIIMPLDRFLARIAPPRIDTASFVLPDGVKAGFSSGATTILAYEAPPRVYALRWLCNDSPAPFGQEARYRTVRLALPYVVVLAVFASGADGQMMLT